MVQNKRQELADPGKARSLTQWLMQLGMEGASQVDILEGYCQRLVDLGIPLARVHVAQQGFNPEFGSIGFDWLRQSGASHEVFERSETPADRWLASPMFHLLASNLEEFHERLIDPDHHSRFPFLNELKASGLTDYLATGLLFEKRPDDLQIDPNTPPEGVLISWASDGANGFSSGDMDLIRQVNPYLGLVLKSASNLQMAHDLLSVYLGRDAGRRVLSGEIGRGSTQKINAVILYFDLTGFTQLSELTPGDALINMLNDYFAVAVRVIQANGGNILKFMGDGLLAMFNMPTLQAAASAGLDAVTALRQYISALNTRRDLDGLPTTGFTIAVHAGDILYGNIGAVNRLDFTAIGPAVNLTARLSGMHRSIGHDIIVSEEIYDAAKTGRHDLVSLGRYMLRGVSEPHELYTVYEPAT